MRSFVYHIALNVKFISLIVKKTFINFLSLWVNRLWWWKGKRGFSWAAWASARRLTWWWRWRESLEIYLDGQIPKYNEYHEYIFPPAVSGRSPFIFTVGHNFSFSLSFNPLMTGSLLWGKNWARLWFFNAANLEPLASKDGFATQRLRSDMWKDECW